MLACEGCVGSWCSLVSTLDCQSRGRGFKSRRARQTIQWFMGADLGSPPSFSLVELTINTARLGTLGSPTLAQHRPYPLDRGPRGPHSVVHAVLFVGLRDHVDLVDLADRAARVVRDDEVDLGHVRLEGTDDRVPHAPDVRRVL